MKKKIWIISISFLIALAVFLTTFSIRGNDAIEYKNELLAKSYDNTAYSKVLVHNDQELRNALTASGDNYIVVDNDITVESELVEKSETYRYFKSIDPIHVNGNKVLNLNGHEVYYSDSSEIYDERSTNGFGNLPKDFNRGYSASSDNYKKTLIYVSNANLTIFDPTNKGTLQFDSMFSDYSFAVENIERNVLRVGNGGKLEVHGGNIIAGRNKQQYLYVHDLVRRVMCYRTATIYNTGSALTLDGGSAYITGGTLKGRGAIRGENYEFGAIRYLDGYLYIEGGSFYGYGQGAAIVIHEDDGSLSSLELDEKAKLKKIIIKGGYFESYSESYAAHLDKTTIEIDMPRFDAIVIHSALTSTDFKVKSVPINYYAKESRCNITKYRSEDADSIGDNGKESFTVTPKQNQTVESLAIKDNLTEIYAYQALNVELDYYFDATYGCRNKFLSSELYQEEFEVDSYNWKDYSLEAYFTISKYNGGEYKAISSFPLTYKMNQDDPYEFCLKTGNDFFSAGEYKIFCQLKETCENKTVTKTTNVLSLTVLEAKDMLDFENVDPENYQKDLGNLEVGDALTLKFNAKAKALLDSHLSLAKSVMYRSPSSNKYVYASYSSFYDDFKIQIDETGYYSVMEIIQLKRGDKVLAQISREIVFRGIDLTYSANVIENPNGTITLAKENGTPSSSFKPGARVLIETTPKSGLGVLDITVKDSQNNSILVTDDSFIMPNSSVTVSVTFEHVHTVTFKMDATSPSSGKVNVGSLGYMLPGAYFKKQGFKQVAWSILGNRYELNEIFTTDANVTAFPIFESIKYNTIHFEFATDTYSIDYNYDYEVNPYYTLPRTENIPSGYLNSKRVEYYTLKESIQSEIDYVLYTEDRKFYPGEEIMPMGEDVVFVAHLSDVHLVDLASATIHCDELLTYGTHLVSVTGVNCDAYFDAEKTKTTLEITINPHDSITFKVYIYPEEDYLFTTPLHLYALNIEDSASDSLVFYHKDDTAIFMSGLNGTAYGIERTYYTSCGTNDIDHNWDSTPTTMPYWCKGETLATYTCLDCGLTKKVEMDEPVDPKIDEYHQLVLLEDQIGDCSQNEFTIAKHYECTGCHKCFSKINGEYVEKDIDEYTYVHAYSDYVPKTIELFGEEVSVHCYICMSCGAIDYDSVGFHKDLNHDQYCDDCNYPMPCNHNFTYEEVPSTCNSQGHLTKTCQECGEEITTYYAFKDHTLEYIDLVESTCTTKGHSSYYKCKDCGQIYDIDIYLHIKEIDPDEIRFIPDLDDIECEYALTSELEAILENHYSSDLNYKYEDALNPGLFHWNWDYIIENCEEYNSNYQLKKAIDAHKIYDDVQSYAISHEKSLNSFTTPINSNNHPELELRNAIEVAIDQDGYSGDLYCKVCNTLIEEGHAIKKHSHSSSSDIFEYDKDGHYHICDQYEGCQEKLDYTPHTYGEYTYKTLTDKKSEKYHTCSVCGYIETLEYDIEAETKDGIKVIEMNLTMDQFKEPLDCKYIFDTAQNQDAALELNIGLIHILFDSNAVKEINSNPTILESFLVSYDNLESYNIENAKLALNVKFNDGVTFQNGTATIKVNLEEIGLSDSIVKVFYIGDSNIELPSKYQDLVLEFETNHFSCYVVSIEKTKEIVDPKPEVTTTENPITTTIDDVIPKENNSNGLPAGAIVGIVLGVVLLLGGAGVFLFFFLRKKKLNTKNEASNENKE